MRLVCAIAPALAALVAGPALASINSISRGDAMVGTHVGNLITNGSFETGNPGTNLGWTPGSHLGGYPGSEVGSIPGWTSSWPDGAYGWWGPLGFATAPIPDGLNAVYFGNSFNTAGASATIGSNGVISFSGTPTFAGRPAPVTLAQTVTGLSTSSSYVLDFWVSGEAGFTGDGLFGLDISGEGTTYLHLPTPANSMGGSERYYVHFTPTSSTITIKFLNWGHITDIGGTGTELVLDDVILNVPAPASLGLLGVFGLAAARRRRD